MHVQHGLANIRDPNTPVRDRDPNIRALKGQGFFLFWLFRDRDLHIWAFQRLKRGDARSVLDGDSSLLGLQGLLHPLRKPLKPCILLIINTNTNISFNVNTNIKNVNINASINTNTNIQLHVNVLIFT